MRESLERYPHLFAALQEAPEAYWERFIVEYDRFADVTGPGSIVDRAVTVAMVKAWLRDPTAELWRAVAIDLDDRLRFALIVAELER